MKRTVGLMLAGALGSLAMTSVAAAQTVKVENAIARVVYMPEERSDIVVEVTGNTANLPAPQVRRERGNVVIDGQLGRRGFRSMNCNGGTRSTPPSRPGEGASVSTRETGRVALEDAPMIVVRGPRGITIRADGAVYGAVGRGAESVDLGSSGCGTWVVANVPGQVKLAISGSGDVWTGSAEDMTIQISGSGDVRVANVEDLSVAIAGSGDVSVRRADGDVRVSIAGSGDVTIADGRIDNLSVNLAGSGDVDIGGVVHDVSASMAGSGDIVIRRVTGDVSQRAMGSGKIRILDRN